MLLQELVKRKNKIVSIVIITILGSLLLTQKAFAETISPIATEVTLSPGDISNQSLTLENENNYDLYLTPTIYKYYPQSEYILELEPYEEFVKITTDYTKIPANSEKQISFQIVAPKSLDFGTYYNIIVFQDEGQEKEDSTIGASAALSHIVKLNLVNNPNSENITEDYSFNLEVTDRGIPFIKNSKLKFTFYNNSQYTLTPKGEIQVVKNSGNKEPEYFKINIGRTKVFPEQSYEQEFEVENWYLEDLLFGKKAYIKVQNGIDENIMNQEVTIASFKNEFLYILATITVIILLATSLKGDTRPEPEYAE